MWLRLLEDLAQPPGGHRSDDYVGTAWRAFPAQGFAEISEDLQVRGQLNLRAVSAVVPDLAHLLCQVLLQTPQADRVALAGQHPGECRSPGSCAQDSYMLHDDQFVGL